MYLLFVIALLVSSVDLRFFSVGLADYFAWVIIFFVFFFKRPALNLGYLLPFIILSLSAFLLHVIYVEVSYSYFLMFLKILSSLLVFFSFFFLSKSLSLEEVDKLLFVLSVLFVILVFYSVIKYLFFDMSRRVSYPFGCEILDIFNCKRDGKDSHLFSVSLVLIYSVIASAYFVFGHGSGGKVLFFTMLLFAVFFATGSRSAVLVFGIFCVVALFVLLLLWCCRTFFYCDVRSEKKYLFFFVVFPYLVINVIAEYFMVARSFLFFSIGVCILLKCEYFSRLRSYE